MDWLLYDAVNGPAEEVTEILRKNPTINVNWRNDRWFGRTPLHRACWGGHDTIVSILLAHPDIDVNQKDDSGWTPFLLACFKGSSPSVRLLLRDQRVKVNESCNGVDTPVEYAASNGRQEVIKWWMASGREMDLGRYKTEARRREKTEAVILLERFRDNPEGTRYQVRLELGLLDDLAAEMFAMVVFLSDGLLQVTDEDRSIATPAAKFFSIAGQLPLELQMVLCFRVVGSAKEIIGGNARELAFWNLAKKSTTQLR